MSVYRRIIKLVLSAIIFTACGVYAEAEPFIIKDLKINAEIIISKDAPRMARLASLELQYYLKKMSGAKVPIIFEKTDVENIKIYVGKSKYTTNLGINDRDLKYGAYHLISGKDYLVLLGYDYDFTHPEPYPVSRKDKMKAYAKWKKKIADKTDSSWNLPWWGAFKKYWNPKNFDDIMLNRFGSDYKCIWYPEALENNKESSKKDELTGFWEQDGCGSLNAVYAFLRSLGIEWYMPGDLGEVVPKLKTIKLPQVNKTDKPDFAMRSWYWYNFSGASYDDLIWAKRIGINSSSQVLGNVSHAHGLSLVHGTPEMQKKHPEYYGLWKGKRLSKGWDHTKACFSSEGLFNETVNFARFMFEEYNQPHISLWPTDGYIHCQCESCKKLSSSDLVWSFVDRVARDLYKTHPDRIVSCGAYTPYIYPPSNVDKFTPNVAVLIANAGREFMDEPIKWSNYTTRLEGWRKKVAPGMIMRVENNRHHLKGGRGAGKPNFPVIHPRNMAKDLKYLNGTSVGECNEVGLIGGRWANPGCDHLNLYVNARFLWDADQDIEKVLAEYYKTFYGPAAKEMETALEFSQAKYSRTNTSSYRGKAKPQNVSIQTKVKLLEFLHKAREAAGDTIYGKRIDVILGELPEHEILQEKLEKLKKEGDPRADAMEVEASKLKDKGSAEIYKLQKTLEHTWGSEELRPELDTTFSIMWTEKSLTFDICCEEPDMESIKNGENVWDGDSVIILLESPYNSYYQIEVAPDGRIFDANRPGAAVTKWDSMADVKIKKGKDFWRAIISIPIAILGEEGAEGDPMHYVVAPKIKEGSEWYFNLGRRHTGEGEKEANPGGWRNIKDTYVYVLNYKKEGKKNHKNMHSRDCFAKLIFK